MKINKFPIFFEYFLLFFFLNKEDNPSKPYFKTVDMGNVREVP